MDPIIAGALAKAAGDASDEGARQTGRLLDRLLGPAADEIGAALARATEQRLRNIGRIVEVADAKTSRSDGQVPPRIAHQILDAGSYVDDSLMAEYLSGVMAASRTPDGRDDRAVTWGALVNGMSALELRAHFLVYRTAARLLHGRTELNLWTQADQYTTQLHLEMAEFMSVLADGSGVPPDQAMAHALLGLQRRDLMGSASAWGPKGYVFAEKVAFDDVIIAFLTPAGIELYGWSLGVAGMRSQEFLVNEIEFVGEDLPTMDQVAMPQLNA